MAITVRHNFDCTFPPAALYLDDVEQIVEILKKKDIHCKVRNSGHGVAVVHEEDVAITFTVKDITCDFLDELRTLATTRVNDLRIDLAGRTLFDIREYGVSLYGSSETQREIYGLLLPIFSSRKRPFWGGNATRLYLAVLGMALICLMAVLGTNHHEVLAISSCVLGITLVVASWFIRFPHSIIYLRRHHEPVPETERWLPPRHELTRILITAAMSLLVGWLLGRFSK